MSEEFNKEFMKLNEKDQKSILNLIQLKNMNKQTEYKRRIDKAINKLDSFISCCKCEKLESGSDYLHYQYWNMFENFNKQVKEILKGEDNNGNN